MMDLVRDLNAWGGVVSIFGTGALAIAMLYLRSVFATKAEVAELVEKIAAVEKQAQHAPTYADFQKVIVAIESVKGDVKVLGSGLTGLERSVTNIGRNVEMLVENELKGARAS